MNRTIAALSFAFLATLPAGAETLRYPVKSIDFDIWCTEVQRYSWQRCDERRKDDVGKFDAYRHTIEKYEIPYLREKENAVHFDDTIFGYDPIDKRPDSTIAKPPSAVSGE